MWATCGADVVTAVRAPQAPLETNANKVSAPDRRRERFEARNTLWAGATSLPRLRNCGRAPVSKAAWVALRERLGQAGFSGLQHCGSVWSCPVCAARILVHRALEIGAVLGRAMEAGHSLGFVTLTMRHRKGQALDLLWKAGGKGWKRAISGRGWVAVEPMVDGWVRVWEVTTGENGWHVHVHAVVVMPGGSTEADLDLVAGGMFERWSAGLQAAGLDAPMRKGQDWHLVAGEDAADQLAEYLSKSVSVLDGLKREAVATGLGLELTHSMPGRAREVQRTEPVWSILGDLVETGEASALRRWHEWESASKGRRQVGWSTGLRDRFAPMLEELEDQAVVDQQLGSEDDDLVRFTVKEWREIVRHPERIPDLLEAAEGQGLSAVKELLDGWGVGYSEPVRVSGPQAAPAAEDRGPALIGVGDQTSSIGSLHSEPPRRATVRGAGGWPPGVAVAPPVTVIEDQGERVYFDRAAVLPALSETSNINPEKPGAGSSPG